MDKENTVGLVIDMQEKLFPHVADRDLILKRTCMLIEGLKIFDIPILVTQQYPKGLGETINEIKGCLKEFKPIDKVAFSCCGEQNFTKKLSNGDTENIIICGIETHVCVMQTALDLLDDGYQPIVVEDCVSSRQLNDKHIAIERMRREGVIITTYESILFEICAKAGTEPFKALSKLVKDHA
jgi:nicotinamidase-related amidase